MGPLCHNFLTISGPLDYVIRIREELKGDNGPLSFAKHLPLEGINKALEIWGTNSDAISNTVFLDDHSSEIDPHLVYSFNTHGLPPKIWFREITKLYKELDLMLEYSEDSERLYGKDTGYFGVYEEEPMTHEEYLMENDDRYPEIVESINSFTQEQLIKYFSGVKNFYDCCQEWDEEWNEHLCDEQQWNEIAMMDYAPLAGAIIGNIKQHNLPLFLNVDWGEPYNEMFSKRFK